MTTQVRKNKRRARWAGLLVPGLIVGAMGACGGRIGRPAELPVGVTMMMPLAATDIVSAARHDYPHAALSVVVGGKVLPFDENFELILTRDQAGEDIVGRYRSAELASSAHDTRCPAEFQATTAGNTALFCHGRLAIDGAAFFTLKRANGQQLQGTTLLTESLDPDAGIRTLSIQY